MYQLVEGESISLCMWRAQKGKNWVFITQTHRHILTQGRLYIMYICFNWWLSHLYCAWTVDFIKVKSIEWQRPHLLEYIPSWWKNYPRLVRARGCTPTPFHYHHAQSCGVPFRWEGRYTPNISVVPLYVLCGQKIPFSTIQKVNFLATFSLYSSRFPPLSSMLQVHCASASPEYRDDISSSFCNSSLFSDTSVPEQA